MLFALCHSNPAVKQSALSAICHSEVNDVISKLSFIDKVSKEFRTSEVHSKKFSDPIQFIAKKFCYGHIFGTKSEPQ